MDAGLAAALQELAVEGSKGCTVSSLWSLLECSGTGAQMTANKRFKQLLWQEIMRVPGMILQLPTSLIVSSADPRVQLVEDAENLGLCLIAPESLRDSSLGMYDLKVCDARLSTEQRNVLECIAASRNKGITQSELAKKFKIPGNKMFYLVKMLEVRGLVVRQATLVRTVDGNADGSKQSPIVATNLLHLPRFAKDFTLSSHQRFEILNPSKDSSQPESTIFGEVPSDQISGKSSSKERAFIIKDDLPAMQAVCQKLEETEGKVLVVSDLKSSLGYRLAVGHRTWRRLVKRLQDAGLVEVLSAQIEQKVRPCIRLVKSFDAKAFKSANDETEHGLPLKCAKRGQVTDMVTELPIDHQIYDIVDNSGLEGIHMIEVFNSLGLQNKRNYYRISTMLERRLLVSEAENHKRSTLYRLKTAKNVYGLKVVQPSSFESHDETIFTSREKRPSSVANVERRELIVSHASNMNEESVGLAGKELSPQKELSLSVSERKAKGSARIALRQARMRKGKSKQDKIVLEGELKSEKDTRSTPTKPDSVDGVPTTLALTEVETQISPLAWCMTPQQFSVTDSTNNVPLSTTRVQREKRMMEKLQAEKFVLRVELHRWLEELENRKNVMMDRKTLSRILQGLQAAGHCKCVMLSMPGLTNCGRQRTIEVVLLPSVVVDPDLLSKVHDQVRKFDMLSRGHGVSRAKPKDSVPVLTGVPRMHTEHPKKITKFDKQSEDGTSMQANGFIPAKMVRVRMLHYFLWGFLNSLPEEDGTGTSKESSSSCKKFSLSSVVHSMPLELFLQTIGSFHRLEHVTDWCKQGLRLCDLPKEEFSRLLDSNATGRLSWLVDVLRRLQLVRLVMGYVPVMQLDQEDLSKSPLSAVLTYAMEREPYLEEPAPAPLPSMSLDSYDLSPRARHEFSIVNKDGLDAYWQNLEYFFSGAQPAVARRAFPGSNVPELFGLRSWASLRVMSIEQRTELMRRVGDGGIEKRKPWHECVLIAKELNLSLQQVLRVSYEKNRIYRLQTLQKAGKPLRKRKSGNVVETLDRKASKKQCQESNVVENEVSECQQSKAATAGVDMEACQDANDGDDDEDNDESFNIGGQPMNDFSFVASMKPSRLRMRRFTWSERLDRLLIASYARQRAQLGALYHRVDWDLMADLPAPPGACRRRMAQLRLDLGIRKALSSLCSLLSLRYIQHVQSRAQKSSAAAAVLSNPPDSAAVSLENSQVSPHCAATHIEKELGTDNTVQGNAQPSTAGTATTDSCQGYHWDDIAEPFLAAALDEVVRCRAVLKAKSNNRAIAIRPKLSKTQHPSSGFITNIASDRRFKNIPESSQDGVLALKDVSMNADLGTGVVPGSTCSHVLALPGLDRKEPELTTQETTYCISNAVPGRSIPSSGPSRRVRKHVRSSLKKTFGVQEISNEQLVKNSTAVANAVELVKLVLLNTSQETPLSGILVDAVQRFKETDVITAIKYLRECGFLMTGQSGQSLALSPKFYQDCSASRYPVGVGADCLVAEQWLCSNMDRIDQEWVSFPSELQSGQLLHWLSAVSTNEFMLTPTLPANDFGVTEDEDSGKRKASTLQQKDVVRNIRPRTLSSAIPQWSTLRKERGYPGIDVSLVRSSISLGNVINTISKELEDLAQEPVPSNSYTSNAASHAACDRNSLQVSDPEKSLRVIQEAKTVTASTEQNALFNLSFRGNRWNSNSGEVYQISPLNSDETCRTTWVTARESLLNDCILHWCPESMNKSAGTMTLSKVTPDVLRAAFSFVEQAGDEGLSLERLASTILINGAISRYNIEDVKAIVQILESFGLVKTVSAYDHVRIIETSRTSCFYLQISHKDGLEAEKRFSSGDYIPHASSSIISKSGDHRIISLRPEGETDSNTEHVAILPWLDQNGSVNELVLKRLTRRLMGLVALHPGISEDTLVEQINVLNPQSVRQLTLILELDGHLLTRLVPGPEVADPPRLLKNLVARKIDSSNPSLARHYFINPLSGRYL